MTRLGTPPAQTMCFCIVPVHRRLPHDYVRMHVHMRGINPHQFLLRRMPSCWCDCCGSKACAGISTLCYETRVPLCLMATCRAWWWRALRPLQKGEKGE